MRLLGEWNALIPSNELQLSFGSQATPPHRECLANKKLEWGLGHHGFHCESRPHTQQGLGASTLLGPIPLHPVFIGPVFLLAVLIKAEVQDANSHAHSV